MKGYVDLPHSVWHFQKLLKQWRDQQEKREGDDLKARSNREVNMMLPIDPQSDITDLTRYALLSALRRRGLIPREDSTDGSVTVEFGNRAITVLLTSDGWVRHIPGHSGSPVLLARQGAEESLARQLARELLDRLP